MSAAARVTGGSGAAIGTAAPVVSLAVAGEEAGTFPALLLCNAERFGDRPAYRFKQLGIWETWTWRHVLEEVRTFAAGLTRLGFRAGDRLAILGRNRPRLYWAMTAAQSLGGVPVPVYHTAAGEELAFVLDHAEVSVAVVEDQEQVDKLLALGDRLPLLRAIVYDEPRSLDEYEHANLHHFPEVQRLGAEGASGEEIEAWRARIARCRPDDLAVLLYTSGTTDRPKGVMLSFANLVVSAANANRFDGLDRSEEVLAYLPMAWIGDHIFSYAQAYCAGYCVCCPESELTVAQDRHDIAPTYFFAPPRVFEELLTLTLIRMEDAGRLKRGMFLTFMDVARRCGEARAAGRAVGLRDRLLYWLGGRLVYEPIKSRFGFSRLRVGYTAGEAIGPEMFGFFRALGINLKQLYGQTEACVYVTMHETGSVDVETVGVPAPGVEIRLAEDGEVFFRGPGAFLGYYKQPEKTAETRSADGWVRTGDAGIFDDKGHLRIIDRARDVGRLAGGGMFAPKYIENKLKFFPEIKEAVAVGDGRDFATVLVNIDLVAIARWAERHDITYASYGEIAGHPRVYDLVAGLVAKVNADLARESWMAHVAIRRFAILHKELDADDGELTRTQKVRRGFIAERFAPLIEALYAGAGTYDVATEVVFEDGRRGTLAGRVRVADVPATADSAKGGAR